uniref:Uncharacterized protein n=1 Tax=Helianthus annuus TaxID=4232 RepID=A0A251SQY6_HELAN
MFTLRLRKKPDFASNLGIFNFGNLNQLLARPSSPRSILMIRLSTAMLFFLIKL